MPPVVIARWVRWIDFLVCLKCRSFKARRAPGRRHIPSQSIQQEVILGVLKKAHFTIRMEPARDFFHADSLLLMGQMIQKADTDNQIKSTRRKFIAANIRRSRSDVGDRCE